MLIKHRYQQAEPDFISSLAGEQTDAGDDIETADEAGEGAELAGGEAEAAPARAPSAAPGQGEGKPADNGGRDQVANLNAALRQERAERKRLEEQLTQLSQRIESIGKPPAPEKAKEPDFLEDPAGVIQNLTKRLDESDKQRKEREETEAKQREEQAKAQENWNKVIASEQEFVKTTPDYNNALAHIRGVLKAQIQLANPDLEDQIREQHPTASDEQVKQEAEARIARQIAIQEAQGAVHLLSKGKNPSQVYYEYAKALGYKPAAAAPQQRVDKEAVRSMGSGGGQPIQEEEGRSVGLSELALAHSELKADRKKNARTR